MGQAPMSSPEVALSFTEYHVIKRDRNCGLLHLNLRACVCCDHFLVEDYYPNYKMQSEVIGRSANVPTERRWGHCNTHFSAPWDLIGLSLYD